MMSPIVRRLARGLVAAAIAILTLVVAIVALLQIPAVATGATRRLLTLVPLNPGYRLEVGRVSGNWLTGLQLEQVRLSRGARELALIERLRVHYDPRQLRGPDRRLRELVVDGAHVVARRERDGWDIANAIRTSADTTSAGGDFVIDRLTVRRVEVAARLAPDSTARVRGLALDGRDLVVGEAVLLTMDTVRASVAPPGEPPLWFEVAAAGAATAEEIRLDPLRIESHRSEIAGRVVLPRSFDDPRIAERLDVRLQALPLALADLASIYPGVPPEGDVRLEATASAEGRLVTARLAARLDPGTIELEGGTVVGRGAPAVYRVHGEVRDLDPSRLHRSAPIGQVNGELEADIRGETLPLADGSASLRLRGSRFGETDLRDLDLRADVKRGRADLVLRGQLFGGSVRADGWARPFDSLPSYRLAGGALGLEGTEAAAKSLAGEAGNPRLDVRFRVGGDGITPREADLDGRVELAAVRTDSGRVPLGGATIELQDGRLEVRPELLVGGGRVSGVATARFEDTITYQVRQGRIDRVDLGKLMGDTVSAPITGRFTLTGRDVAPEEASVTARIEMDELRYAARRVEQVIAQARLDRGRAVLDLRGALQGGRITVLATARPFDSATTFDIRRAALDSVDLGTLLGRPDLAGPVTLGAAGSGRWGESAKAVKGRMTVEPSRLGHVEVAEGTVVAELAGERFTYAASLRTNGGSIALEGEGRPMAEVPSYVVRAGRAESLDLGALLGRDSLTTDLTARFTASLAGTGIDSAQAGMDLELLRSRVNQAELGPGKLTLGLNRGALDGSLRLEGGDAAATARLTGNVGTDTSRVHAEGDLRVERLSRWTGDTAAEGRLEGRFGLDAVADSAGLLSAGGTVTAAGGVGEVRLQQLFLALRPSNGAIALDTLVLRSNIATLDGHGSIPLRGAGSAPVVDSLRITGRTGDLTPLALLAGGDTVALDSTLLDLTVVGPADRRRIEGHADAFRLLYAGNLAERITARGSATMDSAGFGGVAGSIRIRGAAAGKVSVRQADFAGRYDSLVSLQGNVVVNDDVRLALGLQGTTGGDTTRARLQRLDLTEGGRTWRLARPAAITLRPGGVEVGGFALGAGDRHVTIQGIFDRRDSSDMTLRFDGLDLDALAEARIVPLAGRLEGAIRLSGPAVTPSVEGKIALAVRRRGGKDVGRVESELDWTREGLRVKAEAKHLDGGRLTLVGTLPWRLTLVPEDTAAAVGFAREPADTMALAVRADSFDLAFFEPFLPEETAQELTGGLAVDGRIGGTPDQPRASGTIDLRGLGVTLPTLGVTYSKGRFAGRLQAERLEIDTLRLQTGDEEELLATGHVLLQPLADPALDIRARLNDFRISNSDAMRSVASGELQLRGTAAKPSLTGKLQLGRTEIFVGGPTAAAVEEVQLTPGDMLQVARTFGPATLAGAEGGPGFVDRFRIDLQLEFPRRVWFRKTESPSINIELSGRINVRQQPGEPMQFFGQVEPIPERGEMNLYGRTFKVVEGTIALQGPAEATKLDVTAQYQVPTQGDADDEEVLIDVEAKGRPDSLDLAFSSEPAMPEEDIISYIVTGRPASDNPLVDQQGGGGVDASQMAIGQLAGTIGGAAGEELGFDVFQIRQEPARGLTLTAGRYLASRVFVSLQQPLRIGASAEQQTGGSTGPGFELEYSLRRWLRTTLRGGSLPTGVMMRGRYAF
jgi:translocation-and-assembly-module (TAM) inner membrane subunit TamB-like protein